jgi:ABC-2 type transport system permease protein
MSTRSVIWKYQLILLSRNRFLIAGLLFLFVAGLYGARYGKHFVSQQNKVIYSVDTLQERGRQTTLKLLEEKDSAELARRRSFPNWIYYQSSVAGSKTVVYRPTPFAALSIGQKDNYPYYHEIANSRYPADFYSVSTTDVQNPVKLLAGNFDLAFVILYLLPLVIIALGYNALSGEKENNTFTLLRVQTSVYTLLRNKLAFQASLLIALSVVMNFCAFWISGISIAENGPQVSAWIFITAVYIIFWFAVVYLVASLNFPSSTNALVLGGLWILLLLLAPSAVHRAVSSSHEKELAQSIFNRRGDYPTARDLNAEQLKDSFSRLHHKYPLHPMVDTGAAVERFYRNLMATEIQIRNNNAMGRRVVQSQAEEYQRTMALNWINPAFAVQNAFNQVAGTEINNFHNYLAAAEEYQTKRRYELYGYSLAKKTFGVTDFRQLPEFDYQQPVIGIRQSLLLLLPVLVLALLFVIVAALRKIER